MSKAILVMDTPDCCYDCPITVCDADNMSTESMSNIKLKSCPFCGSGARLLYIDEDGSKCCIDTEEELEEYSPAFVHCYGCGMDYMPDDDRPREVIRAWNRREANDVIPKIYEEIAKRMFSAECYNKYFDGRQINNLVCFGDVVEIIEEYLGE